MIQRDSGSAPNSDIRELVYASFLETETLFESSEFLVTNVAWSRAEHLESRVLPSFGAPAFTMLRRGAYLKTVRGETAIGNVNSVIFVNSDEVAKVEHPFTDEAVGTDFHLHPDLISSIISEFEPGNSRDATQPFATPSIQVDPETYLLYRSVLALLTDSSPADPMLVEESLYVLLYRLAAGIYRSPNVTAQTEDPGRRRLQAKIPELAAYLAAHSAQNCTLKQLSDQIGCTPWYLCRLFPTVVGSSISRYVGKIRVRQSLERVLAGDGNLTDVALEAGFSSHSHFTTAFRREFGRAPSHVRGGSSADRVRGLVEGKRPLGSRIRPAFN